MKNQRFLYVAVILFIGLLLYLMIVGIFKNREVVFQNNEKLNVVTSFYPLAEFSKQVGKEKVEVINLTPAGVEPHDFEPTPKDMVKIQKSSVFIYNGIGFEPWVEKILPDIQKEEVVIINTSKDMKLITGKTEENEEHKEKVNIYDPHIWLDPLLASRQIDVIKEGLIKADLQNKSIYETNASNYKKELADLDADFRKGLANCSTRNIIASHEAFGYLAKRYNLNVIPISGLSPGEEPSPSKMAEIVGFARKNNVKYIFFETLVTPRLSDTIARELGVKTLVFNPLEGLTNEEIGQGQNYLSIQQQNLANLKIALRCK